MFCPKCNVTLPAGQFCPTCGTTLIAPPVEATPYLALVKKGLDPKKRNLIIIGGVLVVVLAVVLGFKISADQAEAKRKDGLISNALMYCDIADSDVTMFDARHMKMDDDFSLGTGVGMTGQACVMKQLGGPSNSYDIIYGNYKKTTYVYGEVTIILDWSNYSSIEIMVK